MLRKFSCLAVASLFLLLPAQLIAGGPPRLCLPIDGITPQNAEACAKLLSGKLESKVWQHAEGDRSFQIQEHKGQQYLTFPIGDDVALSDVEAAVKGSGYSIPRDKLRLFGHAILEIDAGKNPPKELLADLEGLNYVSVAESKVKGDRLLVTVDMPYPVSDGRADRETVGWDTFARNDFSSDRSTRSESPAKAATLPSYEAFRDVVARRGASLKDIRWSQEFACRSLGCVAVEDDTVVTKASRSARRAADDK